jgi:anti-anti-sigma factor
MGDEPESPLGESLMGAASGEYRRSSPSLKIETEEHDGAYVVRLSGEVDLETATLLEGALDGRIHNSRNVILDCQHLTYIDSTGLNLLAGLSRQGRRFVMVAPTPTTQKILQIMGLDKRIPVAPSVEEALKVLAKGALGDPASG